MAALTYITWSRRWRPRAWSDTYTSLAGYLLNLLGRLPTVDETVLHDGLEFRVESVTGHRIDSVTVTRQPKEANP